MNEDLEKAAAIVADVALTEEERIAAAAAALRKWANIEGKRGYFETMAIAMMAQHAHDFGGGLSPIEFYKKKVAQ